MPGGEPEGARIPVSVVVSGMEPSSRESSKLLLLLLL